MGGVCGEMVGTLNLRPWRPATLLSTDLMMSHFMRLKRSTQRPSKSWYTCASSNTLKSLMLKGAPCTHTHTPTHSSCHHNTALDTTAAQQQRDSFTPPGFQGLGWLGELVGWGGTKGA